MGQNKYTEYRVWNLTLNNIVVDGQTIEAVDEFIYLGSKLTSDGRCTPDVLRRIGIAFSQ